MNVTLERTLKSIRLGEIQVFHNLAIFPIFIDGITGPNYITLKTALQKGVLKVQEISEHGSVPEVNVINSGEAAVLLLDGEELAGAKQNRVLNTTILLKAMSKTIVNVSCTERGRWAYATRDFQDSDAVMACNIRAKKSRSVSESLKEARGFRSDQVEIWGEIDALCESAGVRSETDAMRDVYEQKQVDLQDKLSNFPKNDNQCGLVFLVDRAVIGLDLVSSTEAYADLHDKLLMSYIVDSNPKNTDTPRLPTSDVVQQFIDLILGCSETYFPSVGLGTDYRLERRELCGSALVHEDTCIHAAFFTNVAFEDGPKMEGFKQRRRFRR